MINWLKKFFSRECEHSWMIEEPLFGLNGSLKVYEGPLYERCKKCGALRQRPDCRHMWLMAPDEDEIKGIVVNGRKIIKTAVCGKCGISKYEVLD